MVVALPEITIDLTEIPTDGLDDSTKTTMEASLECIACVHCYRSCNLDIWLFGACVLVLAKSCRTFQLYY